MLGMTRKNSVGFKIKVLVSTVFGDTSPKREGASVLNLNGRDTRKTERSLLPARPLP